ncbi:MAG: hypothetical protein K2X82_14160 [Gemmataceae bacterium]|nr:hypothetical protein [Gemmataceae bacterium]
MYYPTRVGAEWVYQRDEEEVRVVVADVAAKGEGSVVTSEQIKGGGKRVFWERVAVSGDGLSVIHDGSFEYRPPVRLLRHPHTADDRWRVESSLDSGGGGTPFPLVGLLTVVGEEEVRVPAGTYRAVRVRARMSVFGGWSDERWYAPGVGLVKKDDSRGGSLALKSFRPAR